MNKLFNAETMMKLIKCPFYAETEPNMLWCTIYIRTPTQYVGYIKGLVYWFFPIGYKVIVEEDDAVKGKNIKFNIIDNAIGEKK